MSDLLPSGIFLPDSIPNFAEKIDDKYICIHCHSLLTPPVKQTLCGHRMSAECIAKIKQSGQSTVCPGGEDDCVDISNEGNVLPDFGTEREMKKLKVLCNNKEFGCEEVVEWFKLNNHLLDCQFTPVICGYQNFGCTARVAQSKRDNHMANCLFEPVRCKYCSQDIPRQQMQQGHEEQCALSPKECKFKSMGCNYMGSKQDMDDHLLKDHSKHIEVLMASVAELQLTDTRLRSHIQELKNENDILKNKTEETVQDTNKMKTQYDAKIKNLQKMTGANAEGLLELNKVKEPATFITQLQDVSRIHESRITSLEAGNSGGGGSSGNMSDQLKNNLRSQEQSIQMHDIRLAEYEIRFQCLESTTYDGNLVWKIKDYTRRKQEAKDGRTLSLYSQPFYTNKFGYKMCGRVYLNGDGMGKGSHLSFFFVLMKGDYDALLPWPFRQKVTFSLLDQNTNSAGRHLTDTFRPDPTSTSFKRPTSDMNVATGCPLFAKLNIVESDKYLTNDTIYIKISVDVSDLPNL